MGPLTDPDLADRRIDCRRFLNPANSSTWPGCVAEHARLGHTVVKNTLVRLSTTLCQILLGIWCTFKLWSKQNRTKWYDLKVYSYQANCQIEILWKYILLKYLALPSTTNSHNFSNVFFIWVTWEEQQTLHCCCRV